jgi:hypothetical protein
MQTHTQFQPVLTLMVGVTVAHRFALAAKQKLFV